MADHGRLQEETAAEGEAAAEGAAEEEKGKEAAEDDEDDVGGGEAAGGVLAAVRVVRPADAGAASRKRDFKIQGDFRNHSYLELPRSQTEFGQVQQSSSVAQLTRRQWAAKGKCCC